MILRDLSMQKSFLVLLFMLITSSISAKSYKELDWDSLMPEHELEIMLRMSDLITNPHQPLDPNADIRDEMNSAFDQANDPELQAVMTSINVRPELNNTEGRIPGFIVPVEVNEENAITEFFLVPYFGACIHVPPPPPNQIIFVRYDKGLQIKALWMPFEIYGTLYTEMVENEVAVSAYTFTAVDVKEYEE